MVFALLSLINFFNCVTRMLIPVLGTGLMVKYGIDAGQLGTLYLALAMGFGIALFVAQFVSARFSYAQVISFSTLCSGTILLFFPWIEGMGSLAFYLFCLGGSLGLFVPSTITYFGLILESAKLGRAIGIFSAFQTAGMIAAPLIGPNEETFLGFGLALLVLGAVFQTAAEHREVKGLFPSVSFLKEACRARQNRSMFAFHAMAMGLNIGVYMVAPAYFIGSHEVLFPVLSFSRMLAIFSSILCGFLIDFLGLRIALSMGLLLTGAFTVFLGFLSHNWAIFIFCAQVPLAVALSTMVYVGISQISTPERKGSLVSLFASSSFLLGAGFIPQMMSFLVDWGWCAMGFIVLGCMSSLLGVYYFYRDLLVPEVE